MRSARLAVLSLGLAACSGVADLGTPRRALAPSEAEAVRKKSDEALTAKQWKAAWEQEAEAGGDRARLEGVFVASLSADAGPFEDMHAQLVKKFGALTPEAKTRVARLANEAEGKGDWKRAADILILTAEDAPSYRGAWDLYARASVKAAPDVLHRIQDARKAWDDAHPAPAK